MWFDSVQPGGPEARIARQRVNRSVTVFASTQPLSEVIHPMSRKPRRWMFSEVTNHQIYTTLQTHIGYNHPTTRDEQVRRTSTREIADVSCQGVVTATCPSVLTAGQKFERFEFPKLGVANGLKKIGGFLNHSQLRLYIYINVYI